MDAMDRTNLIASRTEWHALRRLRDVPPEGIELNEPRSEWHALRRLRDVPHGDGSRLRMRQAIIGLCLLWACIALPCIALAQGLDSFEGGSPRFRLVESDCEAQLIEHEISPLMPHAGRTSELFEVSCVRGNQVLLAYPIEPCAALNEFQPSIWVRCSAGNIRLGVRVVFPDAVHPLSQSRMTTIVWGDTYADTGSWQRLQIKSIADGLSRELMTIRQQFETSVNLQHPYIDALVVNAYTGPGRYRVQVDDLDLAGMIPLASVGVPLNANWRESWRWRETETRFGGTNKFPIWFQHRGEQPQWIASLGFTGLMLADVPTSDQLAMVHEAGLSAISPPPAHAIEFDQRQLAALKGWLVGVALNRDQIDSAKRNIEQAERLPEELRRPLVGEALEQFGLFGRLTSYTIVPSPDPVSAGEAASKRQWLTSSLQAIRLRSDGWVSIHAEANPPFVDQIRTARRQIEGDPDTDHSLGGEVALDQFSIAGLQQNPDKSSLATVGMFSAPSNPLGLRHNLIGAVLAGAKGVVYRTLSPLVDPLGSQNEDDRALQAAMRWCNHELMLWSPWLTAGQVLPPPQLDRADFSVARWRVREADLIVAQNIAPESQWCLPSTRNSPLIVTSNHGNESPQVVRLTEGRVEVMAVEVKSGNQQWQVDQPNSTEIFVATRDRAVLAYLRRSLETQAAENAADQLEIANFCVSQTTELAEARFSTSSPNATPSDQTVRIAQQRRLAPIQARLERGWQALQNGQPQTATAIALEVFDQTQGIAHEAFRVATSNLATPQASPFVLMPGTLKYHWMLADACARSRWQSVPIPGSQFTDLGQMQQNGWSQQRRIDDVVNLRVELVPASLDGPSGLRMAAYAKSSSAQPSDAMHRSPITTETSLPGGYEGASLRVRSAGFPVRKGQLVRITAQGLIRHTASDPASGLLVFDNQAGPVLGQLVRGAPGDRVPIEFYRFAVNDGEFRVLAECRGQCDVQLENLQANVIEPATMRSSYVTGPLYNVETSTESQPK